MDTAQIYTIFYTLAFKTLRKMLPHTYIGTGFLYLSEKITALKTKIL